MVRTTDVIGYAHALREREHEVLSELASFSRSAAEHTDWHPQWAKPMDVGGTNGSHHSYTLAKLARRGLAERQQRGMFARDSQHGFLRGSWEYRITELGAAVCEYLDSGVSAPEWLAAKNRELAARISVPPSSAAEGTPFYERTLDTFADDIIATASQSERGDCWYAVLDWGPYGGLEPDFAWSGRTREEAIANCAARCRADARGIGKFAPHNCWSGYDFHWRLCKWWAEKERARV